MKRKLREGAFSLVEVVVAVAVFAGVIVAVLGLLGPSLRVTREALDSTVAARLADAIDGELRLLGFGSATTITATADITLFASPDGARVSLSNEPSTSLKYLGTQERYFAVFIRRLENPPTTATLLPLEIRAEWPYLRSDAESPPLRDDRRAFYLFTTALRP